MDFKNISKAILIFNACSKIFVLLYTFYFFATDYWCLDSPDASFYVQSKLAHN